MVSSIHRKALCLGSICPRYFISSLRKLTKIHKPKNRYRRRPTIPYCNATPNRPMSVGENFVPNISRKDTECSLASPKPSKGYSKNVSQAFSTSSTLTVYDQSWANVMAKALAKVGSTKITIGTRVASTISEGLRFPARQRNNPYMVSAKSAASTVERENVRISSTTGTAVTTIARTNEDKVLACKAFLPKYNATNTAINFGPLSR